MGKIKNLLKNVKKFDKHTKEVKDYDYIFTVGMILFVVFDSLTTYIAIEHMGASEKNPVGVFFFETFGIITGLTIMKIVSLLIFGYLFYRTVPNNKSKLIAFSLSVRQSRLISSTVILCAGIFATVFNGTQIIRYFFF